MNTQPIAPTLIYDGECPLCRKAVEWVVARTSPGAIELLTCQSDERARRFPDIALEQCMQAVQLAMPNGEIHAGHESLPHLFLLMRRWRWMARLFRLPGVSLLAPHAYAFVARHRQILSVLIYEKDPVQTDSCDSDSRCAESESESVKEP